MVLLSAQGMPVAKIADVTFTSQRGWLRGGLPEVQGRPTENLHPPGTPGIKKIAKSRPDEHGLPLSTWSLAKLLADFLVAEGVVDDISHEGLRLLLREEGEARVEHLHAIAGGEVMPEDGEPEVVLCLDEFGPLNLQPDPGRQWAERGGSHRTRRCRR